MTKSLLIAAAFLTFTAVHAQDDDDGFARPAPSDYPAIRSTAPAPRDFVPEGFRLVEQADGDLNSDGRADSVLVVVGSAKKFLNKNDGLGEDPYDTNPRILIILFRYATG